jgi:hypothetical protein
VKTRESGMPEESMWGTFFTPEEVLRKLGLPATGDVVDFGCGYGVYWAGYVTRFRLTQAHAVMTCACERASLKICST